MQQLFSSTHHLLQLARSGKRLPHVLLSLPLSVVFVFAAQFSGGLIALILIVLLSLDDLQSASLDAPQSLAAALLPNTALEQAIFLILAFGPIFLFLWLWLTLFEKRPFWTLGLERDGALFKYARGFVVGLVMFVGAVAISGSLGFMQFEAGGSQLSGLPALGGVLLVLLGWVVQGAAEEALTRGWLLPVIGARYRLWLGVLLSSLLFAGLHSLNPNLSGIAMLNLFLFGLFAALYTLWEGGLWGIFSIHSVWNWAQGNLLGLEVSGNPAPGGTLFNLQETGPDFITGGSFGPEGGLAVTAVLLLACAVVLLLARRNPAPETA